MAPTLRPALRTEECPSGTPSEPEFRQVRVGQADILITRLETGEVVAFAAQCPHQGTPLDDSTFWDGLLRCCRHLYLYDVWTGENVLPAREASPDTLWKLRPGYLPVYRVEERDGWIWVADAPQPPPAAYDPAAEQSPRSPGRRTGGRGPERPPRAGEPGPGSTATSALGGDVASAGAGGPVEHPAEPVRARVGEEFALVLATSPQPGHLWRLASPAPNLTVVSQRFAPDPPPRQEVRLRAGAAGELEVRFIYATPWEEVPKEVRPFVIQVE